MPVRRRSLSPSSGISTASPPIPRIVSKLALEGKSKSNGASVKLYIKLSIPLDSASPGMPIPLFQEESLKILDSIVHPIDQHNVPYAFSNSSLLQASRALNLPNRSSKSYLSLFPHLNPDRVMDERLTGHISVVDFQVTYILPNEIPPKNEDGGFTPSSKLFNSLNFIAALDMVLPFRSVPPMSPFTLLIPIPRCLQNTVRLQILPPSPGLWDASTTPTVSPRPPSSPKSVSSSVSSLISDANEDLVVQGSFPSANVFIVRFALRDDSESREIFSGKRKVFVKSTVAQNEWMILEHGPAYLRVRLAASFKLKGLWYAGVATSLGLEVVLNNFENLVEWDDEKNSGWDIHGSLGYTGYSVVREDETILSSYKLQGNPNIQFPNSVERPVSPPRLGSTSSLLRAPLPQNNELLDFSFEASPMVTPTTSITTASSTDTRFLNDANHGTGESPQPSTPLLLHLEMTDIGLFTHSNLECQIYGTLLIHANAEGLIKLPIFSFPKTAEHRGESLVRSEVDGLRWYSDRALDPIPLVKGVTHRCTESTTLVISQIHDVVIERTSTIAQLASSASPVVSQIQTDSSPLDASSVAFIPEVRITITPLLFWEIGTLSYAVKVYLSCPVQSARPVERVEFGLASASDKASPNIQIISCTVGSRVVNTQLSPGSKESARRQDHGQTSDWVCWVEIPLHEQDSHGLPDASRGHIEVLYLIGYSDIVLGRGLRSSSSCLNAVSPLLPCFPSKVGHLDVKVEGVLGWYSSIQSTNLPIRKTPQDASSYTLQPFFFPSIVLLIERRVERSSERLWLNRMLFLLLGVILYASILHMRSEFERPGLINQSSIPSFPSKSSPPTSLNLSPTSGDLSNLLSTSKAPLFAVDNNVESTIRREHEGTDLSRHPSHKAPVGSHERLNHNSVSTTVSTDLQLRTRAFASFTVNRLQQFYYENIEAVVKSTWQWCKMIWNWPLPP